MFMTVVYYEPENPEEVDDHEAAFYLNAKIKPEHTSFEVRFTEVQHHGWPGFFAKTGVPRVGSVRGEVRYEAGAAVEIYEIIYIGF